MSTRNTSMTSGKPFSLLIRFALPLIAGSVFQQLYVITDAAIVGRGVGTKALAALGAGEWILWMVTGAVQSFAQGFSLEASAAYGEENQARINSSAYHSILLMLGIGGLFTVASLVLMRPALRLLNTPEDIFSGTVTYLTVLYSGVLITSAYQLAAALLRGFGDSKRPLLAMVAASLTNIVLDLLFVFVFHWGIAGAAAATVIAQFLAFVICAYSLRGLISLKERPEIRMDMFRKLIGLGMPLAFQVVVIAAGGLVLQNAVNRYGSAFVAGYTASNKMFGVLESAGIAFGYGIISYTAQNLGAGKTERIPEGIRAGLLFSVIVSGTISACMLVFGKQILSLFIDQSSPDAPEILNIAYSYLCYMAGALFMLYMLHLYKSALQGLGYTVISMISGIIELIIRVAAILIFPYFIGSSGIFAAEISAWIGAAVYLMFMYYRRYRQTIKSVDIQKAGE